MLHYVLPLAEAKGEICILSGLGLVGNEGEKRLTLPNIYIPTKSPPREKAHKALLAYGLIPVFKMAHPVGFLVNLDKKSVERQAVAFAVTLPHADTRPHKELSITRTMEQLMLRPLDDILGRTDCDPNLRLLFSPQASHAAQLRQLGLELEDAAA